MADTVFEVEVGAKYSVSTTRLKKDIQNILDEISKTPPEVTISVNKTKSRASIKKDIGDMFKSNSALDVTLGLKGGSSVKGSTGRAIAKDLRVLTKEISKLEAAKVTLHIDTAATQKAMLAELKKLDLGVAITANGNGGGNAGAQRQKDLQDEKRAVAEMAQLRVEQYKWQQRADKAAENSRAKADAQRKANSYESQYNEKRNTFLQTDAAKRLNVTSTTLDGEVKALKRVNDAYESAGHAVEVVADRTEKATQKTRDTLFSDAATAQKGIYDVQAALTKTERGDANYQELTKWLNDYKTSLAQLKEQANQEFGVSDAEFDKEVAGYEKVVKAAKNCKVAYNNAAKAAEERKTKVTEQTKAEYQALVKSAADIQKKIYALKTENSKSGQNDANVKLNENAILEQKRALMQKMSQAAAQFGIPASQFLTEVNGFEKVANAATKYTKALNDNAQAQTNSKNKTDAERRKDVGSAQAKIKTIIDRLNTSSSAGVKAKAKFEALSKSFEDVKKSAAQMNAEIKEAEKAAKEAGAMAETAGEKFSRMLGTKIGYAAITLLLSEVKTGLRQIYTNVVEIDTGMTELKKVTDETDQTYSKFLDNAAVRAKKLGATISDTVNATASFARLGYSLDEAAELADAAVVYNHVGDEIESIDDASNSVISTMQAFGIEAKDVMSIVDKFNQIGKQNCPAA